MRFARIGTLRRCFGAERVQRLRIPRLREATLTAPIAGIRRLLANGSWNVAAAVIVVPVLIRSNLLDSAGEYIRKHVRGEGCAIVSDSNVTRLFANRVKKSLAVAGFDPTLITIPA